jgi:hypothetical protein
VKADALWERVVQAESRAARAEAELAQIRAATEARLEKQRIRKQRFIEKKEKERAGTSENATERSGTLPSVPAPSSPPSPSSPKPLLTTSSPTPPNSANAEASDEKPSLAVEPKEKPKRDSKAKPWMGEINRVWTEVYPESKAPTGAANMLSPIVSKFGIERVSAELGVYLRATQPQFLSLPKFVATFGGSAVAGSITPKKNPVEQEAEDVWTLCKRYGFAQCTRSTIDGELQRALDAGDIDDVEAFRAKLRKLDIPFLRAVQSDKAAVRSIAERLVA